MRVGGWMIVSLAAVVGCGDETAPFGDGDSEPDPFVDYDPAELSPGNAVAFSGASAPAMFSLGLAPLALLTINSEETCPRVTESGGTKVYEGPCTQSDGTKVLGKATADGAASGGGTIRYEDFGYEKNQACSGVDVEESFIYSGLFTVAEQREGEGTFTVDMQLELTAADDTSCATIHSGAAYDYAGSYAGTADAAGNVSLDDESTWNGSGRLGVEVYGFVQASTEDEVLDNSVCDTEALSGTTTIESGGDVVKVSYDGGSDCDPESTAQWSFNGDPQGEMTGVRCTVAPAWRASRGTWGWAMVVIGLMWHRRRRARPS